MSDSETINASDELIPENSVSEPVSPIDKILDYVTETPGNTNRAVLGSMLQSMVTDILRHTSSEEPTTPIPVGKKYMDATFSHGENTNELLISFSQGSSYRGGAILTYDGSKFNLTYAEDFTSDYIDSEITPTLLGWFNQSVYILFMNMINENQLSNISLAHEVLTASY